MTQRIAIAALLIGLVLWLTPRLFPTPPQKPLPKTPAGAVASAGAVPLPGQPAATTPADSAAGVPNGGPVTGVQGGGRMPAIDMVIHARPSAYRLRFEELARLATHIEREATRIAAKIAAVD